MRGLERSRRARGLSALVAGLVVLTAACSDTENGGTSDPTTASGEPSEATTTEDGTATATQSLECTDGRILVGIAKSQSGPAAFFDVAGTRGVKVAISQANEAGGINDCPLEIIEGDAQSDPAVAAQVARSMLDQGAQILLVPDDFDVGIAAARLGQEAGVLTLSTAASSTEFGKAVGDLFFSGGITTIELGKAQATYALEQGWTTTYEVIDPGLAYFTEQDTHYRDVYEGEGGEVVGVSQVDTLGGEADFSASISQSVRPNPT
jgi:branched-chain amino acid transport system substrate-binding protein